MKGALIIVLAVVLGTAATINHLRHTKIVECWALLYTEEGRAYMQHSQIRVPESFPERELYRFLDGAWVYYEGSKYPVKPCSHHANQGESHVR